jgi:hypothetical protein
MCPDWEGNLPAAFGLSGLAATLGVAVVDAAGRVVGTCTGDDPLAETAALVESALA